MSVVNPVYESTTEGTQQPQANSGTRCDELNNDDADKGKESEHKYEYISVAPKEEAIIL